MCGILLLLWCLNQLNAEKFCVNCKYFKRPFLSINEFGRCTVFPIWEKGKETDYLVTGIKKIEYRFCSTARLEENMCGPQGRYFEKKKIL